MLLLSTTSLKYLGLAKNKVAVKSMISLGNVLSSSMCPLQKLIPDSCDLTPVSCNLLASSNLFSNQNLTHLSLSSNSLGTEAIAVSVHEESRMCSPVTDTELLQYYR